MTTTTEAMHLSYHSPDGEGGYPTNVNFEVIYRLNGTSLGCEMYGMPDAPTPINLAQHSYYNLTEKGMRGTILCKSPRRITHQPMRRKFRQAK